MMAGVDGAEATTRGPDQLIACRC